MSDDQDDAETEFERWNQVYEEYVRPRLERAEKAYNQALASLWLGNGAAALAALSAIGASWRQGQQFPSLLLWPLWFFVLGLVSMGVGAFVALVREARSVHSMLGANATSVLDLRVGDIQSPAVRVGLTFDDWRTRMAGLSAFFFLSGCIVGLLLLTFQR
jgi:hypothetical protein